MVRLLAIRTMLILIATTLAAGCGGGSSGPGTPVITAATLPSGTTGSAYAGYTFTVASGGVAPFTWSETGALPPGLSLSATGALTGTPTIAATYDFTVVVTDSSNPALNGTRPFSIKIDNSTIVVSPVSTIPGGVTSYQYPGLQFSVASGGSPPFTWSVTNGALPPGLSLASDGLLSGTPTSAGPYTFTVSATDSASPAGTGAITVTVNVNDPPPPVITPNLVPATATIGSSYSFQFTASGGHLPLAWAVTSGSPPAGLHLSATGVLTGTPTSLVSSPFTVTVTDTASPPQSNSASFTIAVNNPPPPTINNISLPTATVGSPYSAQFTASGGLAPFVWSANGLMDGLGVGLHGDLSGTPTSAGHFPITVDVRDSLLRSAPTMPFTVRISLARPAGTFTATGSLAIARAGHTATLLNGGKVLVTGGNDGARHAFASAELYDPLTLMFTATQPMTEARTGHSATLLANAALPKYGDVLILGSGDDTAELYDPVAGSFTATGKMVTARQVATATLLNTGKVLIVGGNSASGDLRAELYDPVTGTFAATGSLSVFRAGHTATLLLDGRVLIAGGVSSLTSTCCAWATAEVYDPASGTFSATGSMTIVRTGHTATRLQDGTVLIVSADDATADLFDPSNGMFVGVGDLPALATAHTASLRGDGTVLVAGGYQYGSAIVNHLLRQGVCTRFVESFRRSDVATAMFAPESQGFTSGSTGTARAGHTATVLDDGTLLLIGGFQFTLRSKATQGCQNFYTTTTLLSSAELYK